MFVLSIRQCLAHFTEGFMILFSKKKKNSVSIGGKDYKDYSGYSLTFYYFRCRADLGRSFCL